MNADKQAYNLPLSPCKIQRPCKPLSLCPASPVSPASPAGPASPAQPARPASPTSLASPAGPVRPAQLAQPASPTGQASLLIIFTETLSWMEVVTKSACACARACMCMGSPSYGHLCVGGLCGITTLTRHFAMPSKCAEAQTTLSSVAPASAIDR